MAPTAAAAPKKTASARKPAAHPTFLAMVQECILAHPEEARAGVSRPTIKKFLANQYKLDLSSQSNINNLSNAIKKGADTGIFLLPKGIGGKVKLAAKGKKTAAGKENVAPKKPAAAKKAAPAAAPKKKAAAATTTKTSAAKKTATAKKPAAAKKTATKKAPAAKAKAAAPAKKPAAKKAAAK